MKIKLPNELPMRLQFFAEPGEDGSDENQMPPQPADNTDQGNETNPNQEQNDNSEPEVSEKKYTDEDVNEMINKKFAKWKKEQEQNESENKKYENMTKAEKAEYNRKKAEEKAQSAESELNKYKMRDQVRSTASEAGIELEDSDLDHLVTGDADSTQKNVEWIKGLQERLSTSIKEELRKGNPPLINNGQPTKGSKGEQLAKGNSSTKDDPYFKKGE